MGREVVGGGDGVFGIVVVVLNVSHRLVFETKQTFYYLTIFPIRIYIDKNCIMQCDLNLEKFIIVLYSETPLTRKVL